MRDLIILGAGPHAQEMAEIAEWLNRTVPTWRLLGYLVPEPQGERVGQMHGGHPVLGTYAALGQYAEACFVPEYGSHPPDLPAGRMVSLVAPTAFVSSTARLGPGCVIYPGCFVGHNAALGERVFVLSGSVINHDDRLEDQVTLCSGVILAGHVHVERGAYLGQGCMVRQHLRIGRGSTIGMGAVVVKDVPAHSVMAGNPARRLREADSV